MEISSAVSLWLYKVFFYTEIDCVVYNEGALMDHLTKLEESKLSGKACRDIDVHAAHLAHIDLSHIAVDRFNACGADFKGGSFANASVRDGDFESCNFRGADLSRAVFMECGFREADLSDANLEGTFMVACSAQSAQFERSQWLSGNLNGSLFDGAVFERANLARVSAKRATFRNANLTEADLSGGDFTEADFTGALLRNTKWNGARIDGAKFDPGVTVQT
jgi:uncharacterized protein YjbI with pentapeptide repeats